MVAYLNWQRWFNDETNADDELCVYDDDDDDDGSCSVDSAGEELDNQRDKPCLSHNGFAIARRVLPPLTLGRGAWECRSQADMKCIEQPPTT